MRQLFTWVLAVLVVLAVPSLAGPDHLILGLDDDAGMLLYPRQIEEGPDGDLYVLDAGDGCIKVYSPAGEFRRRLAGEGEGPGLFQRVDGATFGFTPDGRLYFTEFIGGHRWITTMDLDGRRIRVLSLELETGYGVEAAEPLTGTDFLVQLTFSSSTRAHQDHYLYDVPQALVRVDDAGAIQAELKRTTFTKLISYSPDGGTTNLPYTPSFAWCALDDERVVWSDGLSPELQVIDRDGEFVGVIATPLPEPEAVTRAELRDWQQRRKEMMLSRNPAWWYEFGRVVESYDDALFDKPILDRISRTPAGNLLVEGERRAGSGGQRYWLLREDGGLIAEVVADAWRLRLAETFALFLANDEEGATLAHVVARGGDDEETVKRVAAVAGSE